MAGPTTLFELCDAVLCSPAPVGSVPSLSLEPVFRRSHGSVYTALARGRLDEDRWITQLDWAPAGLVARLRGRATAVARRLIGASPYPVDGTDAR